MTRLNIVTVLGGLLVAGSVAAMLRRGRLQYRYASIWLGLVVVTVPLAARPTFLDRLGKWLGIADPPNLLFFVALIGLLSLVALLTSELSQAQHRLRKLAEEVALLEARVPPPAQVGTQGPRESEATLEPDN